MFQNESSCFSKLAVSSAMQRDHENETKETNNHISFNSFNVEDEEEEDEDEDEKEIEIDIINEKNNNVEEEEEKEEEEEEEEIEIEKLDEEENETDIGKRNSYVMSSRAHEQPVIKRFKLKLRHRNLIKRMDLFNSKYDCAICRKKLRFKADQLVHMKLKHAANQKLNAIIKCFYCARTFKSHFHLTAHLMRIHLDERPYSCKLCKLKRFASFTQLKRHCQTHHSKRTRSHRFLDLIGYDNASSLSSLSSSSLSPFPDDQLVSTNEKYLKFLLRIRKNEINYMDQLKSVNVTKETQKSQPSSSTTSKQSFMVVVQLNCRQCRLCERMCMSEADYLLHTLVDHMLTNESDRIKYTLDCWLCHFDYRNQYETKHSSNQLCKIDQEFSNLKRHLELKHTFEMPYKCSMCADMYFNDAHEVLAHLTSAHAVTPLSHSIVFSCATCQQTHDSHERLVTHFMTNSKCNPCHMSNYACRECIQSFTYELSYDFHLKQHELVNELSSRQIIRLPNLYTPVEATSQRCSNNSNTTEPIIYKKTPIFKKTQKTSKANSNLNQRVSNQRSFYNHKTKNNGHVLNSLSNFSIDSIIGNNRRLSTESEYETNESVESKLKLQLNPFASSSFLTPTSPKYGRTEEESFESDSESPVLGTNLKRSKPTSSHQVVDGENGFARFLGASKKMKQTMSSSKSNEQAGSLNSASMVDVSAEAATLAQASNAFMNPFFIQSILANFIASSLALNKPTPTTNNNTNMNLFNTTAFLTNPLMQSSILESANTLLKTFSQNLASGNSTSTFKTVNSNTNTNNISNSNMSSILASPFQNYLAQQSSLPLRSQTSLKSTLNNNRHQNSLTHNQNHSSTSMINNNNNNNNNNSNTYLTVKCDLCNSAFNSAIDMSKHQVMHESKNPKRPLKCHLCQVTFAKSDQLVRHMIVHQANEMDSVCRICFSSFSRKQDLDRHMLFHSK